MRIQGDAATPRWVVDDIASSGDVATSRWVVDDVASSVARCGQAGVWSYGCG